MIPPALSRTIVPGIQDGVPGQPVSRAYGNPGVATNPGRPGQGWPYPPTGIPYSGALRNPQQPGNAYGGDPPSGHVNVIGVQQPNRTYWRGGLAPDGPNQKLITRDRHIMRRNMLPRTGVEESVPGTPPNPDAPSQGLPRPSYMMLDRQMNFQQGSDNTANQDDLTRAYSRNAQGMYIGEQGTGWSPVYGGVPGLYQPYGSYSGYTARDTKGIQSPVEQGQPGDGPRKVFSGPPHGLHSLTMADYTQTLGRYQAVPQMQSVRVDRPANSKIAGQDFSQTVVPQGEVGTSASMPTRFTSRSRFKQ